MYALVHISDKCERQNVDSILYSYFINASCVRKNKTAKQYKVGQQMLELTLSLTPRYGIQHRDCITI